MSSSHSSPQGWNQEDTLLIGIGNSGRRDDGLGWAFLDAVAQWGGFRGVVTYRYQLQIEDAELITHFPAVIFVDASRRAYEKGFSFEECAPAQDMPYSTHALPPEAVVGLSHRLYQHFPRVYLLAIQGDEWRLEEGLSPGARQHLGTAFSFFQGLMKDGGEKNKYKNLDN